jgi:predicted transcriptional regulator
MAKLGRPEKCSLQQILAAIEDSGAIHTVIAKRLGVSPDAVHNYSERHPEVADALEEERQKVCDLAEAQLIKKLKEGHIAAIIFYLKCKAKDRGFTERTEVTGKDGAPVGLGLSLAGRLRQLHRSGQLKDFSDSELLPAPAADTDEEQDEDAPSLQ